MIDPFSWTFLIAFAYVGLTLGALAWICLKHVTADWRVRRRHRAIKKGDIEFDFGDCTSASAPVIHIVLVHGVWSLRGNWHQRNSEFLRCLESELKKHCGGCRVRVRRFLWTGGNTLTDRNRAAGRFRREIAAFSAQPGLAATFVVAHSHGGNVALQAIASDPALSQQVTGIVAIATPFLAAHQRRGLMAYPLSLVNGALFSALSLIVCQGLLLWPQWGTPEADVFLGVATVLSMLVSSWQSRRIARAIPSSQVVAGLSKRLLVIRTSGDEAGASLGASYVLAYAARVLSRFIVSFVEVPTRWVQDWVRGEPNSKPRWGEEVVQLTVAVASLSVLFWLSQFGNAVVRVATVPAMIVAVWFGASVVAVWSGRVVTETCRVVVHGIVETAVAGALLPFGPETYIAAPYVIVSAEAVPATGESPEEAVAVLQLPLKDLVLQHSFDRHREEIARIVSLFVACKVQHMGTQVRAA